MSPAGPALPARSTRRRPGATHSAPEKATACASVKSTMAPDRRQVPVPAGKSTEIPELPTAFSWGRASRVKCHQNVVSGQEAGQHPPSSSNSHLLDIVKYIIDSVTLIVGAAQIM